MSETFEQFHSQTNSLLQPALPLTIKTVAITQPSYVAWSGQDEAHDLGRRLEVHGKVSEEPRAVKTNADVRLLRTLIKPRSRRSMLDNERCSMSLIATESVAEILGLGANVRTARELESAVSAGLPKQSLERVTLRLFPDKKAANAYLFKVVPNATWKRRTTKLSLPESEKTERLARVLAFAEYVFRDEKEAREWMIKPHPEMDSMVPADVTRTELGARRVEELLGRIVFGLPV